MIEEPAYTDLMLAIERIKTHISETLTQDFDDFTGNEVRDILISNIELLAKATDLLMDTITNMDRIIRAFKESE